MIHLSEPTLSGREREYVLDALALGELSGNGSYVERFEQAFAAFCGAKHAVACCNGTVALHLALLALGVGPGDDVYVPALTYVATANAVTYCGARPVFCDVNVRTWCIEPAEIGKAIKRSEMEGRHPAAIIPVHLYGVPASMDAILRFELPVIEDAAQAHGAYYRGCHVGSLGALATFSFFGNKILTTGEGGMVVTSSGNLDEKLRLLRGQGMTARYVHPVIGYNYRMGNLQAALGLAQVENFEALRRSRLAVARRYAAKLGDVAKPCQGEPGSIPAHWLYTVLVPEGCDRDRVMTLMLEDGIETRPVFVPLLDLPPYQSGLTVSPFARGIAKRGISLPTHASLSLQAVDVIVESFQRAVRLAMVSHVAA